MDSSVLRSIPALPWSRHLARAAALTAALVAGWEFACRAAGYAPGLDDTIDLWADARASVAADSTVIVGSSRGLFGLDLDVLEDTLGRRPVQLALVGSNPIPVLEDLAADATFHGDVILDLVPGLLVVPEDSPPWQNAAKAVARRRHRSAAEYLGHLLSLPLERSLAFLQQEDLTLAALLARLPVPDRAATQLPPALPPWFYELDGDRRARMAHRIETDTAFAERVQQIWLPLFTPPSPPRWVAPAVFGAAVGALAQQRFEQLARAVATIRERGGRVVFVRMPSTGPLRGLERERTPRAAVWERAMRDCGVPGVHFEDHAELADFECPEWSHLSAADSVEFTRRLAPHLVAALGRRAPRSAANVDAVSRAR